MAAHTLTGRSGATHTLRGMSVATYTLRSMSLTKPDSCGHKYFSSSLLIKLPCLCTAVYEGVLSDLQSILLMISFPGNRYKPFLTDGILDTNASL